MTWKLLFVLLAFPVLASAVSRMRDPGAVTGLSGHRWAAETTSNLKHDELLSFGYAGDSFETLDKDANTLQGVGGISDRAEPHHRMLTSDLFNTVFCRATPEAPASGGNLYRNPSFTQGTAYWSGFGGTLRAAKDPLTGVSFGLDTSRPGTYSGPAQNFGTLPAGSYELAIWVRLGSGPRQPIRATMRYGADGTQQQYSCVASAMAKSFCWTKVMGGFMLDSPQQQVTVYVEGPSVDVDVHATSGTLLRLDLQQWRANQTQRIQQLRMRPVSLLINSSSSSSSSGGPVRGAAVQVQQLAPDFPFGGGTNGGIVFDQNFQKWFLARFNWAVYANEAKWYFVEWQRGAVNFTIPRLMTDLLRSKGVKIRGHNIFWDVQGYVQGWVQGLSKEELWRAVQQHLAGEVSFFRGQFEHWDVLNEPLHGGFYSSRLGPKVLAWMFNATHQADPTARLFVNDYNTVEQCDPTSDPENYLAKVWQISRAGGAPVHGIGVESHFSSAPMPVRVRHTFDQLAAAGIPLWVTELDLSGSGQTKSQLADSLEVYLREAFSHSAVQGIMLWTTAQVRCLVYRDADPSWCAQVCQNCLADNVNGNYVDNEIGRRYLSLRKEWSTAFNATTDGTGSLSFLGFHGTYQITVQWNGRSYARNFSVPKGSTPLAITLTI